MKNAHRSAVLILAAASALRAYTLHAQQLNPQQIVSAAVQVELAADRDDHSAWVYKDHDVTPDHDTLYLVAECPQGIIRRKLEDHGHPLTPDQVHAEDARLQAFLHDPARQQRQKHDEKHDDDQADAMLTMLPNAFIWTMASDDGERVTLNFRPNPNFTPTSIAAKVLSSMAGKIVVFRPQNRIEIIEGKLVSDVTMGWGMLMRLRAGGSFFVQRKEVGPGHWQITDSRVHIDGHALFFKTIGEQEDESKTDFRLSTAQTVAQAIAIVNEGR